MEKTTAIKMNNGTEKSLKDMTQNDLPNVLLSEKEGKTWLTMKSIVIASDATHITERRLYKWNVMPLLVMYDVRYGNSLAVLTKELGEKEVYSLAMRDFVIAQDKLHNGISGSDPEASSQKATVKLVANLRAMGQNKAADEIETTMAKVNSVKKGMLKAGFGK